MKLVIGEDCSSDGTREICNTFSSAYPRAIKLLPGERNLGMIANVIRTLKACSGSYIAFCEGDDYWTDPLKLQKQIDFLEKNPDYGMVHTAFKWDFCESKTEHGSGRNIPVGEVYDDFLKRSFIGNLTTVTRKSIIDDFLKNFEVKLSDWAFYDSPLWLYVASCSKIGYINEVTAVFRRHANAMTNFVSVSDELKLFKNSYEIRFFFMENLKKPQTETIRKVKENYYKGLLELNSKLQDHKKSKEAFSYLKMNDLITLRDSLNLLASNGIVSRYIANFLIFLLFGKKYFIRKLKKRYNAIFI